MQQKNFLIVLSLGFFSAFISVLVLIVAVGLLVSMYLSTQDVQYFSLGPKGLLNVITYAKVNGSTNTTFRSGAIIISLSAGLINALIAYLAAKAYQNKRKRLAN